MGDDIVGLKERILVFNAVLERWVIFFQCRTT